MAGHIPTREEDEKLLEWLRLRSRGAKTPDIGALYSTTENRVRVSTNRVVKADAALCGLGVLDAYWPGARA